MVISPKYIRTSFVPGKSFVKAFAGIINLHSRKLWPISGERGVLVQDRRYKKGLGARNILCKLILVLDWIFYTGETPEEGGSRPHAV